MASITTVLFDLGGVVCRFRPDVRLQALASMAGLPEREVQACIWDSGFDRDCDLGRYTAEAMHQQINALLRLRLTLDELGSLWATGFETDPAVLRVVDAVRPHTRKALLTNNDPILRDSMPVLFSDVWRRFDPALFSCDFGAIKPSPALFSRVLEHLRERPERVFLGDDSPANVNGARSVGLQATLFTTAESLRRELAERDLLVDPMPC